MNFSVLDFSFLFIDSIGLSTWTIVSSVNKESFISFNPIQMTFLSFFLFFSLLTSLAGPSSIMLNRTGDSGYPGLASSLRGKASFLS